MSTANELLAAACTSGISCLDEMNLLRVIAQGSNAGGGGGGGGGGTLSTDGTFAANSDLLYPSQKAAKTYIDTGLAGKQNSLGFTPENVANKSTDGTFAANSDTLYPSQKAAKTYVDNAITVTAAGLYVLKAGDTMTGALILPVGSAAAPSLGVGGTTSGLLRPAANQLGISTAGTQRMVVNAAGLVGIGITAPLAKLHVTPSASGTDYFRIDHSDGTPRLQVGVITGSPEYAGVWIGSSTPSATNYQIASSDNATVFLNAGTTLNFGIGGTQRWLLISSGHLLTQVDNTYDIGSAGANRPRALYLAGLADIGGAVTGSSSIKSVSASAGIGYGTGAGGTVTQITSRSTGVTLDKITGQITTTADSLAGLTIVTFVVTNSTIAATDTIVLSKVSGDVDTSCFVAAVGAGSFSVSLRNNHTVDADTTAFVLNFAVIKAVTS